MTKPVPYFPLYAASFIASKEFRLMTIEERGLWITIQMECWVNGSVPSDLKELGQYLGVNPEVIERSFTQKQLSFLERINHELKSPELEEYKNDFMERREKQRLGGIKGAKRKKDKALGQLESLAKGQPKGSLIQINSNSINSNQLLNKDVMSDENMKWVNDYEHAADISASYLKVSKG